MDLWAERLQGLWHGTGEFTATRDELAAAVETTPNDVSIMMSELESVGAATRDRGKTVDMR